MKLLHLSNIVLGHPFRGKVPEKKGSGVYAVQMKDVSLLAGIDWASCVEVEITGKRKPDWLIQGDVLFVARGRNNYAVLVDEAVHQVQAVAAPHFYLLRCKQQQLLPAYLVWFLNQGPSQRYFQREAEGSVTKSIRRSVLESVTVAVPSLKRQQGIVNLAETIKQEQRTINQLIRNGKNMMNAIANDLLAGLK